MGDLIWPVLITVFTWWFTTGVILYLDGLDRRFMKWTMAAFTGILVASVAGTWMLAPTTTVAGAYLGFACGIGAWAWQEMSFLAGVITGPRKTACPLAARPLQRFTAAIGTILWHEIAIIAGAVVLAIACWNQPNQTALWTYCILWLMRTSAKLNLFLGARMLSEEFLPDHMRYLATYFRRAPMNALFPFSVAGGLVVVFVLASWAVLPAATAYEVTSYTILATLLGLAVLEHCLMMLPLPSTRLWSWGMASHAKPALHLPDLGKKITPAE
jgi:putative photosynthetic complex assembly protein 2